MTRREYNEELRRQARHNFIHNTSMLSEAERAAELAEYDSRNHDHEIPFLVPDDVISQNEPELGPRQTLVECGFCNAVVPRIKSIVNDAPWCGQCELPEDQDGE